MTIFEPNSKSLLQFSVPEWFSDAKFGIFIHWGIYSVPAMFDEWYPRRMYQKNTAAYNYHREIYGEDFGYKDFIPKFQAEKFDPLFWMKLFRDAGARYVVPVAEHHDGFAMYSTPLSRWNAAEIGPKRDIIGELEEAATKVGLVFGVSSHRAEHWWFMNGGRDYKSDVNDQKYEDFYGPSMPSPEGGSKEWEDDDWIPRPDAIFLEDWLLRSCELVDRFHPKVVYFDWWIHQKAFKPYLLNFASYYYNKINDGLITYKLNAFEKGTAVFDIERGFDPKIEVEPWQTCTSISKKSWGFIVNQIYKNPGEIIHHLIDVVSKNGCLLLNVGPKPDGTIPEEEQKILSEIGHWLAINGDAIYCSRPWRLFGEGPTLVPEGSFIDNDVVFDSRDIRFTTKNGRLFAITLGVPDKFVEIKSLCHEKVMTVKLLGVDSEMPFTQSESGLVIQLLKNNSCKYACVFEITI